MDDRITYIKSKAFAVRTVKLYQYLCKEKHEFILSQQLLKSGTSIGANIAEANCAFSDKDFLAKMYIAFKECAETEYWLELLYDSQILTEHQFKSMYDDCSEKRDYCLQ